MIGDERDRMGIGCAIATAVLWIGLAWFALDLWL